MKRLFTAILIILYGLFVSEACIGFCEHSIAKSLTKAASFKEACKYKSDHNNSYIVSFVKSTFVSKPVKLLYAYCNSNICYTLANNFFENSSLTKQLFQGCSQLFIKNCVFRL